MVPSFFRTAAFGASSATRIFLWWVSMKHQKKKIIYHSRPHRDRLAGRDKSLPLLKTLLFQLAKPLLRHGRVRAPSWARTRTLLLAEENN